ncbi:hypothetical protein PENTCL1PPCAC_29903, partial [Pristionchus entomophagus]
SLLRIGNKISTNPLNSHSNMHLWILLGISSLVFASQPCGISNSGAVEDGATRFRRFILGGKNSSLGTWPWQVLLSKIKYRNGKPLKKVMCGGINGTNS